MVGEPVIRLENNSIESVINKRGKENFWGVEYIYIWLHIVTIKTLFINEILINL